MLFGTDIVCALNQHSTTDVACCRQIQQRIGRPLQRDQGRFITLGRATEYLRLRGSWNRISKEYELRRYVLQHMVRVLDVALWGLTTDWDKFQGRQNACGTYRQYVSLGIDYCPNLRANLGNQDRFIIRQLLGLVKVVARGRRQIWGGLGKIGLTSEYSKTINDDNKTISSITVWDTIPGISFCCCGLSSCQLGWLFSAEITNDDGVIKEETNDVVNSNQGTATSQRRVWLQEGLFGSYLFIRDERNKATHPPTRTAKYLGMGNPLEVVAAAIMRQ